MASSSNTASPAAAPAAGQAVTVQAPTVVPAQATNSHASASLYVGDLSPEVTEALLFEVFKAVGLVASIRVCRDAITRRSLGYAYVNFHSVADAERALDTLNFTPIAGRNCRIMWSQRDPAKRKAGVGNIFIKNLDKSIDNSVLYDTFSAFGNILSCKVELDSAGQSKGYAYVHYETGEEADLAISRVNGMLLAEKQVFVGPFLPRKDRSKDEGDKKFTNVFVKNLSEDVTNEKITEEFNKYGKVQNVVIMQDENGKSKGFGFISMDKPEEAAKAVEALNGQMFGSKVVFVGRAQKKSERDEELKSQRFEALQKYQGVNLYVKNLDDAVDDDRLRQEFSRFGNITSARIMRDDKGNSRGFGFVCFSTPDEATRAVTEMNASILISKPLYVGLAQRKDVRRAQLEVQHQQRMTGGMPGAPLRMMTPPHPAMYANGAPMFYPGGPMPQRVMGYPQQMQRMARPPGFQSQHGGPNGAPQAPRPTGPNGSQGFGNGMPNYVVPGGQRPQRGPNPNINGNNRRPGPGQSTIAPVVGGAISPNTVPQNGNPAIVGQNGKPRQPQGPNQQNNQRVKFSSTVRNQPTQVVHTGMVTPPVQQQAPLQTPEQLEAMMGGTEEAKQVVGEQLFVQIQNKQPTLAAKITGMFLDSMELRELFALVNNRQGLEGKIMEALHVLNTAGIESPAVTEGRDASVSV